MRVRPLVTATRDNERGSCPAANRIRTLEALGRSAAGLTACGVAAFLALASAAVANPLAPYASMAPIDAYLMDRTEEIALAKSAAPDAISKDATILVMTRTGYETALAGTNGFVCWVGRGFSGAPDWSERWNPKILAAECENPAAARSVLPLAKLRTAMTLARRTDAEIIARIKAALAAKEIPALEPGAMSYMMSKSSYLGDGAVHDMAHLMFFVAVRDGAAWGANATGSPLIGGAYWFIAPDKEPQAADLPPLSVFITGVATWSDGTPAMAHAM